MSLTEALAKEIREVEDDIAEEDQLIQKLQDALREARKDKRKREVNRTKLLEIRHRHHRGIAQKKIYKKAKYTKVEAIILKKQRLEKEVKNLPDDLEAITEALGSQHISPPQSQAMQVDQPQQLLLEDRK